MKKGLLAFLLVGIALQAIPVIDGIPALRKTYELSPDYDRAPVEKVTIAILDSGFSGLIDRDTERKSFLRPGMLPATTEAVEDFAPYFGTECQDKVTPKDKAPFFVSKNFDASPHGRVMAQTVWAMTGNNPAGPRIVLLNTNGLKNFRCAIRYAYEFAKADIILHSHTFAYGGDFNGKGFINSYVNEATSRGILWVNAAGNYGGYVYNGPVKDVTHLRVRSNVTDIPVTVNLAWTGTPEKQTDGTDKDLDLEIMDSKGRLLPVENYKQVRRTSNPKADPTDPRNEDTQPFETVTVTLDRNQPSDPKDFYWIRVVKRGGVFFPQDSMRVSLLISPERGAPLTTQNGKPLMPVEFVDATAGKEIMIPADNPTVITAADLQPWSAQGPTMDGRIKPEITLVRSNVEYSVGTQEAGSSHAAAMLAGILVQMKAFAPHLNREEVLKFVEATQTPPSVARVPAPGFLPKQIQPVAFQTLQEDHAFGRELVRHLDKAAPTSPMQPFRTPDGNFIVSMDRPPALEGGIFGSFAQQNKDHLQDFEYYVAMDPRRNRPFSITRNHKTVPAAPYPWDALAGYKKSDFVELRYVPFIDVKIPGKKVPNLWRTPSKRRLLESTART